MGAIELSKGKIETHGPVTILVRRWRRLKNAMGTSSSAFVAASLQQLIAAARLPNSGICEIAVNASLAFIEGAKPRDEIECALVIQMACR